MQLARRANPSLTCAPSPHPLLLSVHHRRICTFRSPLAAVRVFPFRLHTRFLIDGFSAPRLAVASLAASTLVAFAPRRNTTASMTAAAAPLSWSELQALADSSFVPPDVVRGPANAHTHTRLFDAPDGTVPDVILYRGMCACACMCLCRRLCMRVRACVLACMCARVMRACMRACVRARVRVSMRACGICVRMQQCIWR